MSLSELRERLQGPRRPYDTWYGKNVMRAFSIYGTVFFARVGASPSFVTLVSLVAGVLALDPLVHGRWIWGLFWVNAWYLLDHCDGELARLKVASSASGLYFDTIVNAIVPPLSLAALGYGLSAATGEEAAFYAGLAAAYGSLMLLVVSYCEAAVLLQASKGGMTTTASKPEAPRPKSASGKIFGVIHTAVAFPTFLPAVTGVAIAARLFRPAALEPTLEVLLGTYAFLISFVWAAVLAKAVLTKQADRRLAERA